MTENAVGCFSFFRCLHCWMKSCIHPPSSKNTPVSKPTFKRVTKKSLFDVDVVPAENTGKGVFFLHENECISKSGKNEESDFG